MSDVDYEEDYEEASDEQKLNIATYFIMSSPIGEVDFVCADTAKLIGNDNLLDASALNNILKEYNMEQMISANIPDSEKKLIISTYGQVSDTEFIDPNAGTVRIFDHTTREFTGTSDKKVDVSDEHQQQREGIQKEVDTYLSDKYKQGKACAVVYCGDANSKQIVICISAQNTKISSYWTGGWNSVFTVTGVDKEGAQELVGNIKVHVHYFEDGNVQLHSAVEKKIEVSISSDPSKTGKSIANAIDRVESAYQLGLEEMYVDMHDNTFKALRRFLPITKTPMNWNISAHGIGKKK